ncbi:hypothetical protein SADUNF_Sadunf18G0083800 [Salix dunnii]|uniref:Protein kinase domain-containing protein n=1 Tax=Salix dunnii TaxID=1413687 RepID=A0A835MDS7_9ROSI|nr:hypothetical protein SADUNF_Sadunf18G0083800 [Salix dunnii]
MGSCKFSMFRFLCLIIILFVVFGEEVSPQIAKERISLLSFRSDVVSDPEGALESWNSSGIHVCNWTGVKCNNASGHVVQLDLSGLSLRGRISPVLANLSSLLVLDLSRNFFEGHIPAELGDLLQLRQLSLSWNLLGGNIPEELGSLHHLVYLDLGSNRLAGDIPVPLFCNGSSSLEYMDLSNNSLTGEIPLKNECKLGALRFLLLWSNRVVGRVPRALSNSTNLEWLDLESNMLSGELPSEIVRKMPKLQFLYLSYNDFVSHDGNTNLEPFFSSLVNSSNLQELELAGNNLLGEIPPIIGDLSTNCVQIHLDENLLYGSIPSHISNLVNLTLLNLSSNLLNGTIPPELCRMGKLERVYLSNNSLSGEIPAALANISHLGLLDLSKNKLTGSIPDSFAHLSQLRRLFLYENQLSGTIPPSLGQCVNLEILDLSRNNISGTIPGEVAGLRSLKLYLNLSSNHLHGPLPLELSKMDMVLAIDLSSNNLSGTIPPQLGSCIALEYLNLSGNVLEGLLPATIGQLPYLKELDVSSNQLSGNIPQSMEASPTLKHLNFSFNKFSGNISSNGAFSSLTIDSFRGNDGLCGEIKGMPNCRRGHVIHPSFILPVLLSLFATPLLCMFAYPLVLRSKFRSQTVILNGGNLEDEDKETKDLKHPRISYRQLIEATGGADDRNSTDDSVSFSSSTHGFLCGSVGYIAPEYGMGKRASTQGDVYSFGVLLLEIITGRRPTDVLFHEGSSLHEWVKSHYPHKLKPIVDQAVLRCAPSVMQGSYNKICSDVILELIELGLVCTQNNPSTRPSMLDVASEMGSLKQYLSSPPSLVIEESYPKASAS